MTQTSGTAKRQRILFFAEAVTLAHVARPRVLADGLDPARYEVHFAAAPSFDHALVGLNGRRWPLFSLSPRRFMDSLARGTPLYDTQTLERYVSDDLALIEQVAPDLVVGDFRLSLAISAPLAKIPYLALANAYWSPFALMPRWPIPDLPPVRLFGELIARAVFNGIRPLVFLRHGIPLNRVRRRHGLTPVGNMLHAYTWGDETLYLDLPQLIPMEPLPHNHSFIGPVIWEPNIELPEWWDGLPKGRQTLYVTLGSSGPAQLLPELLAELARLPVNILVATAGRVDPASLPAGVWSANFLPGTLAASRADLVISNGGSPAGYQALSQGTPVLGIPSNLDQHLATHHILNSGAGGMVRSDRLTPARLRTAVTEMLEEPKFSEAAERVGHWFSGLRPEQALAQRIAARL